MLVRIISADNKVWYRDRVGQVYNVTVSFTADDVFNPDTYYKVIEKGYNNHYLRKYDCEIIELIQAVNTPDAQSNDVKDTNPKDSAATARLDISLFPDSALVYGALGMTEGDLKYGGYNYRVSGVNLSVYIAALERHRIRFYSGEWADKKTGVPHLASMLSCIAIIIEGFEKDNIVDDRPPFIGLSELLDSMEEKVKHLQKIFPRKTPRYTQAQHSSSTDDSTD